MRSLFVVSLLASVLVFAMTQDCPEGWETKCSRDMKQFTKKDAKGFCKSLQGKYKKGICYISSEIGVAANACCYVGK